MWKLRKLSQGLSKKGCKKSKANCGWCLKKLEAVEEGRREKEEKEIVMWVEGRLDNKQNNVTTFLLLEKYEAELVS